MAKTYHFYNDDKTVNSEYISDNMGNHETFFIEELRNVDSSNIKAGLNLDIKGYTETELATLASNLGLTLAVYNDGVFVEYLNSDNNIWDFVFEEQTGGATINATAHTVAIEVANGTTVTALVASFLLSAGAGAKVSTTDQVSGTTANDFTSPAVYIIESASGVTQNWTVTVTVAA